MSKSPYISIVCPISDMKNGDYFLNRLQNSIEMQSFTDFEIVITKEGKMAENTNAGIQRAKGKLIKILFMDDYLLHEDSLQEIVDNFDENSMWLATGCVHDNGREIASPHTPSFSGIPYNQNTIGSPSVITIRNKNTLFFDETMSWMLDVDYYKRMNELYGPPILLNNINVAIGIHTGQMTNILTDEEKMKEELYIKQKHG